MDAPTQPVVVVGGGVAGLVAAYHLAAAGHDEVVVLESTNRPGGNLRSAEVAGCRVDVGAEAMLSRRPEGVALARQLGLPVVHPTAASPRVWTRGELRPLPRTIMGVPADLGALEASGILSREGLSRAREDRDPPPPADDVSVAGLVAPRLGREVVDRLVEPLLGGVYAGRADELSARATVPAVLDLARRGRLVAGAAAQPAEDGPVFAGVDGGMSGIVDALAGAGRFRLRTSVTVREVRRAATGFELVTGSAARPERQAAAHLVLATPPAATARLLTGVAPVAAAELAGVEAASVAVVTLAFEAVALAGAPALGGHVSGFLVPPVDGRVVKAATFSFAKWAWVRAAGADLRLLRVSLGRHREEAVLQVTDEELVAAAVADLMSAVGTLAAPVDVHVQRWGGGLPQYAVGHQDRVARIRAALARANAAAAGTVALCGAAYDGVGVPAVVASAERAAREIGPGGGSGPPVPGAGRPAQWDA